MSEDQVEARTGVGWERGAAQQGNYQRWRVRASPQVTARVARMAVWGIRDRPSRTRIYEVCSAEALL